MRTILAALVLLMLPTVATAGKYTSQTCKTSTFAGTTTTTCDRPRVTCKSSTFAGVTRTVCR